MLSKSRLCVPALAVFVAVECTLGVLMHTVNGKFSLFAYTSVVLAFLFNLLFFRRSFGFAFTATALAFTLVADYFLVVRGDMYVVAMVFFSIAQLSYAARVHIELDGTIGRIHLIVRAALSVTALVLPFIVLGSSADALSVISVFYFAQLITSCIFAFINTRRGGLILPIGLLLFLFCDIFVGFGNLGGYLPIEPGSFAAWLAHPPINMAWVFYLPSQTLLGMSMMKK